MNSIPLTTNERNNQTLLVLVNEKGIKVRMEPFVVCSNYHPEAKFGEQWDWGHYFGSLEGALEYLNREDD